MSQNAVMLFFALFLALRCLGQGVPEVVQGKVVSEKGAPLPGVEVYGTKWSCCPVTVKSTTTKGDGTFSLGNPGVVVHFRRLGLEPFSIVNAKAMPLAVVMKDQQSTIWELKRCGPERQSRFDGEFLFQRPAGAPLSTGRDVDYIRFGMKGSDGGWLDSWFGSMAGDVDASEEIYVKSKSFSERFVDVPNFGIVGIDARGLSTNGRHWRWLGLNYAPGVDNGKSLLGRHPAWHWPRMIANNMIRYENTTESEARDFDAVIDSVCLGRE
jgi:hypothetical protein